VAAAVYASAPTVQDQFTVSAATERLDEYVEKLFPIVLRHPESSQQASDVLARLSLHQTRPEREGALV
jgi:hypothetical protein